jgi:hypothetical protein
LISGSSQVSYTGLSNVPAGIVSGSAQVSFNGIVDKPTLVSSSAQIVGYNVFATTGSNQFNGSQAVTGSLTVTGQVVAQTLNVQQVTSSIVYSSGSNVFGNSLSNTQQFTGSVSVTGSLTVNGAGTFASSVTAGGIISTSGTGLNASVRINNTTSSTGKDWHLYSLNNGNFGLYNNTDGSYAYQVTPAGIATFTGTTVAANGSVNIESTDPAIRFRVTSGTANSRIYEWRAVAAGGVNDIMQLRLWNDAQSSASTLLTVSPTGAGIFSSTVTATKGFFSSNAASDSSTGLLANASTNDSSTYAAIFGSLNAGYRMVVRADGNVGIGTTSPNSKLDIRDGNIELSDSAFSNIPEIRFTGNSGGRYVYAGIKADEDGVFNGHLEFWTTPNSPNSTAANAAFAERMRITAGGNVGIGTTDPSNHKLYVQGNLSMSGSGLMRTYTAQSTTLGAKFDIFRFLNDAGSLIAQGAISGILFINASDTATGGNQISYTFHLQTNGNGTSQANLTQMSFQLRGTQPITSIALENDGGGGGVKVVANVVGSGVSGCIVRATFVGVAI